MTNLDNQPFEFNLDTVKAETELLPFRVHWGGRRWEFKHIQALDVWDLLDESESDTKAVLSIFEAALGDQFPDFRKLPLPQFKVQALFDAYQEFCGVKTGE